LNLVDYPTPTSARRVVLRAWADSNHSITPGYHRRKHGGQPTTCQTAQVSESLMQPTNI
jgi:hypothetical protein